MTGAAPVLLAEDSVLARPLSITMWLGAGTGTGVPARRDPDGSWWRAEPGTLGPLLLHVQPDRGRVAVRVLGDPSTPAPEAALALHAARAWAGLDDDPAELAALVADHAVLRRLVTRLGPPVIGVLPRAAESFGMALLSQKVQGVEAVRSIAGLIRLRGTPAAGGLSAYPAREALHAVADHDLRPVGISATAARALRLFATDEPTAQRVAASRDWARLDALVRRIPGCGTWTSAETRLFLGDADAVSYGDFHTATLVGWAIGDRTETDEAMAVLLAPFAPHRGRVVRLIERAAGAGLVPVRARRAPRAPVAWHRFG